MKVLVIIIVITVGLKAQTAFPPITDPTGSQGSDVTTNPTYQCGPPTFSPDTCQFKWTSANPGMSRVLLNYCGFGSCGGGVGGYVPARWVDDPTQTTTHSVTVNNLYPGSNWVVALGNCFTNGAPPTQANCDQYNSNWSVWNCKASSINSPGQSCLMDVTKGNVPVPAASKIASSPVWKILGYGSRITYPNRFAVLNLQWLVGQIAPDDANVRGYIDSVQIAPVDGSGNVGTYLTCPVPVLTVAADPPGSGWYKSGGNCGNGIIAFVFIGNIARARGNWPTPWAFYTVGSGFTDNTSIQGKVQWGFSLNLTGLQNPGIATFMGGSTTMYLMVWPQSNAVPGTYSVKVNYALLKTLAYPCHATGTSPDPNGCKTNYSSGNTFSYVDQIVVKPIPAPTTPPAYSSLTQPSPGMSQYQKIVQHHMAASLAKDCEQYKRWNGFGGWNNRNLSYGYGNNSPSHPGTMYFYDGTKNRFEIHDWLRDNITADWQASNAYVQGDIILHGGTYYEAEVVTGAGLSGSSQPSFPARFILDATVDNQVTWINIGTLAMWNECASNASQQYGNWLGYVDLANEANEWTQGQALRYFRTNDQIATNCQPNGGCSGAIVNNVTRVASLYPNGHGNMEGNVAEFVPISTVRAVPDGVQSNIVQWLITGQKQPYFETILNTLINQLEFTMAYSPYDRAATFTIGFPPGPNESACCSTSPTYDSGLGLNAIVNADMAYYWSTGSFAPELLDIVYRNAQSVWPKYFQQHQTFPYAPWSMTTNLIVQSSLLNNFDIATYAWLWRMLGDSCVMPNMAGGTDSCVSVADRLAYDGFSLTNAGYSFKQDNQLFWWFDWWPWRNGSMAPTDSHMLPGQNVAEPNIPDATAPYHYQDGISTIPIPSVVVDASGNAAFRWYTFKKVASGSVGISNAYDNVGTTGATQPPVQPFGSTGNQPPTIYPCSNFTSTYDSTKGYNIWQNNCTVSGLANGLWYWGPQSTSTTGLVAVPPFQPNIQVYGGSVPPFGGPGTPPSTLPVCSGGSPCDACDWGGNSTTSTPACEWSVDGQSWSYFFIPARTISKTLTITGKITGPGNTGVTVFLDGALRDSQTTDSTGQYVFNVPTSTKANGYGQSYVMTPSSPGSVFAPASQQVYVTSASVASGTSTNFVVAAAPAPPGGLITPRIGPGP